MSAVLTRAPAGGGKAGSLIVDAAWRVMPGALMLCGWSPTRLPESGAVRVPGASGVFRSLSWPQPSAGEAGTGFIAALRLPARADPANGAALVLLGDGAAPVPVVLPLEAAGAAAFGQVAARIAAGPGTGHATGHATGSATGSATGQAGAVARFMLDTLRTPAREDMPDVAAAVATLLRAFLSQAEVGDGCIEMIARVPGTCVVLQGWGAPVSGAVEVLLAGPGLARFSGHAGEFSRVDVAAPATGVMLVLPPEAEAALPAIDHVFILSERGVHSRTVIEQRHLDPEASAGHLRHMLPSLRCAAPMAAILTDAIRPRFDGRDTISGHALPVRAAVDCVVAAAGVGVYLSGWIFDPRRVIASVHVCGSDGFIERLDGHWTRIPRPDVSDAFAQTPGFPVPPDADAGFAVFTPAAPTAAGNLHLRVDFADGDRAFLPLPPSDPAQASVRVRLLAGIDMHKRSGLPIIERHLAPLMARVRPGVQAMPAVVLRGPLERPHPMVVPLSAGQAPRALLSGFLHDPLSSDEQLILVCGPNWNEGALASLGGLLRFYGLPASILLTAETAVAPVALAAAAAVTVAEALLLVGPTACGGALGWRAALRAALRTGAGAGFACPTLLYEDWSVRFAGSSVPAYCDGPPYTRRSVAMAGMPGTLVAAPGGTRAVRTATGTLACCLLTRAAATLPPAPGALATGDGREAWFFARLGQAGLAGLWVPDVQVYAPEDRGEIAESPVNELAAELVDGWVLRNAWRMRGNT